jgi:hypothetical protein
MDVRQNTGGSRNYRRRKPDPDGFARKHAQAPRREKAGAYWRNLNRPPGKEVALAAERSEKRDAAAAVSEGIEDAVRRGHRRKPEE